ncbi:MAG: hypothetical protein R3350_09310, partial [Saprospiraceae bacterium]|nr:hypothetical protein [Saprospiraceae bacterium]
DKVRLRRAYDTEPSASNYSSPPRVQNYKRYGIQQFRLGHYEDAADAFEFWLEEYPEDPSAHFNLACTLSIIGEHEDAFYHLEKAVNFGFDKLDKIHDHDALADLRRHSDFKSFVENGYQRTENISTQKVAEEDSPEEETIELSSVDLLQQIEELGKLKEKGILTEREFALQKRKLLSE